MLRVAQLLTLPALLPASTAFTHLELRNGKAILYPDLGSYAVSMSHVPDRGGIPNPRSPLVAITPLGEGPLGTCPLKRLRITSLLLTTQLQEVGMEGWPQDPLLSAHLVSLHRCRVW